MFYITFSNGLLTNNSTWCQNRGCICISSTRRTYGRIHEQFFCIQSSHPDKYNNSVNRIISKEEEREDPRRDSSIYLRVQWCFHKNYKIPSNTVYSYKNYSVSTRNPASFQSSRAILHTELILLQDFSKKYYNYKAHPCRLLPATVPRVSKHSTWQNKAPGLPYSIPRPHSTSRLPVILHGRNSIPGGRQRPRSPYSSSQAHSFRILPGEIVFIPKGLSIVYPCNTKVSVLQFTCYKNINSIQSSSNSMRRYSTLSSIQVILVAVLHKIHCNGYEYTRNRS